MKEKVEELRKILSNANLSRLSDKSNNYKYQLFYDVELIQLTEGDENTIEFDNLKQAIEVFSIVSESNFISYIKGEIKKKAKILDIDLDKKIFIKIHIS